MFPFCCQSNTGYQTKSRENYRQHQLEFLKMIQDHLEAGLAAVSAAIHTIEAQVQNSDSQPEEDAA